MEEAIQHEEPEREVRFRSEMKARDVSTKARDCVVVAADTVVMVAGEVFQKPADADDAVRMLSRMSGSVHRVLTAITIAPPGGGEMTTGIASTDVTFRRLSEEQIWAYASSGEALGKAGAYAVQGRGALLVERINGEYANLMGFPISRFIDLLDEVGLDLADQP
jgi:septum formation protein